MKNSTLSDSYWQNAERYLKNFAWFIIISIVVGLIATHVPALRGDHWSTCQAGGSNFECQIIMHIWSVAIVGFNAFFAWYSLKKYQRQSAHQTNLLLLMTNAINIVYLAFQTGILLDAIHRDAPSWVTMIMTGIMVILLLGITLGIITNQKLIRAIYSV